MRRHSLARTDVSCVVVPQSCAPRTRKPLRTPSARTCPNHGTTWLGPGFATIPGQVERPGSACGHACDPRPSWPRARSQRSASPPAVTWPNAPSSLRSPHPCCRLPLRRPVPLMSLCPMAWILLACLVALVGAFAACDWWLLAPHLRPSAAGRSGGAQPAAAAAFEPSSRRARSRRSSSRRRNRRHHQRGLGPLRCASSLRGSAAVPRTSLRQR